MKQLVTFLSILFFASCSTAPDNIIYDQKSEKGNWVYDSEFKKPIQENIEYVQIAPTWGQAFYYASKRTDRPIFVGLAILLFVLFFALFYAKVSDASWFPKFLDNMIVFNVVLFILLVSSISLYISHPSSIKYNNDKWIEKSVFDRAILASESTQHVWDSLQNNCLIIDGPYNCFIK